MKILTRIIFTVVVLLMLSLIFIGITALCSSRMHENLLKMAASQKHFVLFALVSSTFINLIYLISSVGILFLKKWARITVICMPLFMLTISYLGVYVFHLTSPNHLDRNLINFFSVLPVGVPIFLSVYLLIPNVRLFFK